MIAGGAAVALVLAASDFLEKYRVQPLVTALIAFIVVAWVWRWFFRNFIGLTCPKCQRKGGFEIAGTTGRFRCEDCGTEF